MFVKSSLNVQKKEKGEGGGQGCGRPHICCEIFLVLTNLITGVVMFIVPILAAAGLLAAPLVPFVRPAAKRLSSICMRGEGLSEYEKYQRARGADSFKDAEDQYKTVRAVITPFKGLLSRVHV
jgi:hypothetical protein